jgi:hypothetical protein
MDMNETTESATSAALKRSAGEARSEAKGLASEAQQQARGMIEEKKGALADQLSGVARAFRNASGDLESSPIGKYVDDLAASVDRVAANIKERDLQGVASDVQSFARRQPALFIGGCVAVGFALSRFLKASEKKEALDVDVDVDTDWSTSPMPYEGEQGIQSLSHESWDEPLVDPSNEVPR